MEQVIIKISGSGFFKLCAEDPVPVFKRMDESGMELCCQSKRFSRVAGCQDFFYGAFAGKPVVHPGGVKVSEALFQKQVHHLFYLLQIDIRRVR